MTLCHYLFLIFSHFVTLKIKKPTVLPQNSDGTSIEIMMSKQFNLKLKIWRIKL